MGRSGYDATAHLQGRRCRRCLVDTYGTAFARRRCIIIGKLGEILLKHGTDPNLEGGESLGARFGPARAKGGAKKNPAGPQTARGPTHCRGLLGGALAAWWSETILK